MEVERRGSIFPGTDGGLFAYVAAADGVGQRIEVRALRRCLVCWLAA